jgi:hypothetical protein
MEMTKMTNDSEKNGMMGISELLGIVFIVLKLCKVIDWSWWWVTSHFWIPAAILIAFCSLLKVIIAFSDRKKKEK